MRKIERLKKDAKRACARRFHVLYPFVNERSDYAHSRCIHCGRAVSVHSNPALNGIGIWGQAVAENCGLS